MFDVSEEAERDARAKVAEHLRRVGREMGAVSRSVARSIELHPTQLLALDHLLRGGPSSPGQLSDALDLSTGATTPLIDNLETLGHVRREPDPHDRRRSVLVLTDHARTESREAFRPLGKRFAGMLDHYSAEVLGIIDGFMTELRQNLRDYAAERDALLSRRRGSKRGMPGP
jgi:DNA-binding MarR family transcriptional regulator